MADSNLEIIKGPGANGKKRRLALLLSVLLTVTVFVSCSEAAEIVPEYEANLSKLFVSMSTFFIDKSSD